MAVGTTHRQFRTLPIRRGALAGLTAAAAALLAQWLLHSATQSTPWIPYSFGDAFIREAPGSLATDAIERFGKHAREYIVIGMTVALLAAAAIPSLAWRWAAPVVVLAASLVGAAIQPIEPGLGDAASSTAVATFAAILVIVVDRESAASPASPAPLLRSRRILVLSGLAAGIGALAIAAGIERATRSTVHGTVQAVRRLTVRPDPAFETVPDLSPLITPPADHYIIDINLARPALDRESYMLTIRGEVERDANLTFADLLAMGPVEKAIHLQCISNHVGGDLAGNATWSVLPLADILAAAQPTADARSVVVKAYDGYHESYTLDDIPEIYVALAMGGLEIPNEHGAPVRLLYPAHYGMRGMKWLTSIEVRGEERSEHPGYWQKRGWDDIAPLKVGSRIDTPKSGAQPSSTVTVAGVAWGPEPITRVEISADDGQTWPFEATLEPLADEHSWVRWKADLDLAPGSYDVRARATAGSTVQDGTYAAPHPSGSAGYDLRIVKIA